MDKEQAKTELAKIVSRCRSMSQATQTNLVKRINAVVDQITVTEKLSGRNFRESCVHHPAPKDYAPKKNKTTVMTDAMATQGDAQAESWRDKKKSGKVNQ